VSSVSLENPFKGFQKESAWIFEEFQKALIALRAKEIGRRRFSLISEMAVIRLHNCWARFCREIILSSAADMPLTSNGAKVSKAPNIRRRGEVVPLISRLTGNRYEPKWATASKALLAAQRLQISNLATVSAALGAMNSPAEDLRHIRNFFAHRCKGTADEIRLLNWFSSNSSMETEALLCANVLGGVTRFESWILGLENVARMAIQ
jgi:hypothetical protein